MKQMRRKLHCFCRKRVEHEVTAEFRYTDLSADCGFFPGGHHVGKAETGRCISRPIRALARELKISVITTMKAYEQLESEGLVTAMQGKGFYVNSQDSDMMKEQYMRKVEESLQDAIDAAKVAGISKEELMETFSVLLQMKD